MAEEMKSSSISVKKSGKGRVSGKRVSKKKTAASAAKQMKTNKRAKKKVSAKLRGELIGSQKNEITEYYIYSKLAKVVKGNNNRKIMQRIADDELRHYEFWKSFTNQDVKPNRIKIWWFYWISRLFGYTFGLKLMESGEENAQETYAGYIDEIADAKKIMKDEDRHEQELIGMIQESRLDYVGSIVLGLNDALVELTGALAGLTFAMQNTQLIALSGLITGIAASFSMAGSEYLSTKSEGGENALTSALYTGAAYIITVAILITPFLTLKNHFLALGISLASAVLIIVVFNFYVSVAKDLSFRRRFLEMAGLSLGIAAFSFGLGYLIRIWLGVEV